MNYADEVAYIKSSTYRQRVIDYLAQNGASIPSVIAQKTDIRQSHISKVLKELANKQVIHCLNNEARKGRLYEITEKGFKIIDELDEVKSWKTN